MNRFDLSDLRGLRHLCHLRLWGWPGALGLVCLLAAVVVWLWVLPHQQQRVEAADAALRALRRQAALAAQPPASATGSAATRPWQAFFDAFGPVDERPQRVAALWAQAQAHGLVPVRSEFVTEPVAELPLQRLRLALPVSGPYAQVRAFIAEALRGDPLLSLDGLRIERSSPADAVVQVQMQWSFWSRQP